MLIYNEVKSTYSRNKNKNKSKRESFEYLIRLII